MQSLRALLLAGDEPRDDHRGLSGDVALPHHGLLLAGSPERSSGGEPVDFPPGLPPKPVDLLQLAARKFACVGLDVIDG